MDFWFDVKNTQNKNTKCDMVYKALMNKKKNPLFAKFLEIKMLSDGFQWKYFEENEDVIH